MERQKLISLKRMTGLLVSCLLVISLPGRLHAEEQNVTFHTQDNVAISAVIRFPANVAGKMPAVIFIHQGGSGKDEWTSLDIFQETAGSGMIAMAYDVRGHGGSGSDGITGAPGIFDDPNRAPLDLKAALDYLSETGRVDESRIAVVGASIGANLASMAAGKTGFRVKTAVAISGKTSAVYNLAGGEKSDIAFTSIFHIASGQEQDGLRAKWAREMYDLTADPKKLEIIPGSSGHGVSIFKDDPALQKRILTWLIKTL